MKYKRDFDCIQVISTSKSKSKKKAFNMTI